MNSEEKAQLKALMSQARSRRDASVITRDKVAELKRLRRDMQNEKASERMDEPAPLPTVRPFEILSKKEKLRRFREIEQEFEEEMRAVERTHSSPPRKKRAVESTDDSAQSVDESMIPKGFFDDPKEEAEARARSKTKVDMLAEWEHAKDEMLKENEKSVEKETNEKIDDDDEDVVLVAESAEDKEADSRLRSQLSSLRARKDDTRNMREERLRALRQRRKQAPRLTQEEEHFIPDGEWIDWRAKSI